MKVQCCKACGDTAARSEENEVVVDGAGEKEALQKKMFICVRWNIVLCSVRIVRMLTVSFLIGKKHVKVR